MLQNLQHNFVIIAYAVCVHYCTDKTQLLRPILDATQIIIRDSVLVL
jgi:hypothetical protein